MLKVLQHTEQRQAIEHQGVRLLVLSSLQQYSEREVLNADALIFTEMEVQEVVQVLAELRRHRDKKLYLKPVFSTFNNSYNALSLDGQTDLVNNDQVVTTARQINARIEQVNTSIVPHDFEKQNLFKFLAYQYTRDVIATPSPSRDSRIGYVFPFLDSLYLKSDPLNLVGVLKEAAGKGLTSQKLIDKVHACNDCHGNYLNFREVCPKCKSVDLEAKDLVHHFKCAHVDVIDNFKDGDGLTCPKCEQKLRHIGIDYDKPSTMNHCNDCHHEFQDSDMVAYCIDCGREEETQNLIEIEINSYALTNQGESLVRNGWHEEVGQKPESTQQTITFDLFRMMIKLEIQRANAGSASVLSEIKISDKIIQLFGSDGRQLFVDEMTGIIRPYLLESDLLTAKSAESFYVLFVGKTESEAMETVQLIEHNLTKLICDNLDDHEELVTATAKPITSDLHIDDLL